MYEFHLAHFGTVINWLVHADTLALLHDRNNAIERDSPGWLDVVYVKHALNAYMPKDPTIRGIHV